ncbi:hypothetical protein [Pseudaminobacter arsenicus]|uniref:hypothetical protein n=1 Tax=Borborobacter arsenicus TaxID=1851146 RepID=UPI001405114D
MAHTGFVSQPFSGNSPAWKGQRSKFAATHRGARQIVAACSPCPHLRHICNLSVRPPPRS